MGMLLNQNISLANIATGVILPVSDGLQYFNLFNDGSQLPAFRTLMQKTQVAYKQQQLAEAERYALQAQRIAPQATETYLYLALIADQRKQYANAEALARRGLSYAQSNSMKKQLWLIVMRASEARNHPVKAQEAKKAIQAL